MSEPAFIHSAMQAAPVDPDWNARYTQAREAARAVRFLDALTPFPNLRRWYTDASAKPNWKAWEVPCP